MADLDLQAIHDELISVAYDAGAMMLAANPADIDTGTKLNCKSESCLYSLSHPLSSRAHVLHEHKTYAHTALT